MSTILSSVVAAAAAAAGAYRDDVSDREKSKRRIDDVRKNRFYNIVERNCSYT